MRETWGEGFREIIKISDFNCSMCNKNDLCIVCYVAHRPEPKVFIYAPLEDRNRIVPNDVSFMLVLCEKCRKIAERDVRYLSSSPSEVPTKNIDPSVVAVIQGFEL